MTCRICGTYSGVLFFSTHMMSLCGPCHSESPIPVTYNEFNGRYWNGDNDVPNETRKEFYDDYKTSGLTFNDYISQTTETVY